MVAPVTGPFFSSQTLAGSYTTIQKVGYKQAKPYNLPLARTMTKTTGWDRLISSNVSGLYDSGLVMNTSWSPSGNMGNYNRHSQYAYNQAYEKFRAKIGDRAGWSENVAQFKKTADSLNDRLEQMARFAGHLRRGRWTQAARSLKVPKPQNVSAKKALSANFLEYTYGWAPLLSDISSSVSILTDTEFASRRIRASAYDYWQETSSSSGSDVAGHWDSRGFQKCKIKVGVFATGKVTNPNLFLAGSMGLIDPALPWKLVPFSFVVDWFINVEQVISSMTGFLGVDLQHKCHHYFVEGYAEGRKTTWYWENYPPPLGRSLSINLSTSQRRTTQLSRVVGIPSPQLVIKPFDGFSLNRGLQALALIITVLTERK